MRYWILTALFSGLLTLIIYIFAPEMVGSPANYAGVAICALIALVITWRDPPGMLDNVLLFLFKWGIVASGLAFSVWGIGYKLALWGEHNSDELASSAFDTMLPDLAILAGILIVSGFCLLLRNR